MDYSFIFLSNKVEILYQGLKKSIFHQGANPFARRLIIVPSPSMKSYLKRAMAEDPDLQICFGLEFSFLDQGLESIKRFHPKRVPSFFELSIVIENEINEILKGEAKLPIWQPLINYFDEARAKKRNLKISWLADELSRLFLLYGEYGSNMVETWERGESNDWQAELWQRIYCQKNFTPLCRSFDSLKELDYQEIHLFGLSFISDLKHKFIKKAAVSIPVYSWLLSPCQKLWSDIHSDKESNAISSFWLNGEISESNLRDLRDLLQDRNPFLANFGKLGRHMAETLENFYPQTHGSYEIALSVANHLEFETLIGPETTYNSNDINLLNAIQADLALMRVPHGTISLSLPDNSIQIHSSSSILNEVENAYQTILRIIDEGKGSIEPQDIIIMAPEITEYAPYINMIFGHKDSQLDYQIMDLKLLSKGELTQAFVQLIQLGQSKWKMDAIIKLFSYSSFAKKQDLESEDISELKKILSSQEITWGLSNSHRNEILKKDGFKPLLETSEKGTWQEGIDSLLMGLACNTENSDLDLNVLPKEKIEFSSADLLGKFIRCLKNLERDLLPLSLDQEKTLAEWGIYFKELLIKYFDVSHELVEEQEILGTAFLKLQRASDEIPSQTFPAASVIDRLQSLFELKEYCYRERHLQALKISSLLPMRAVPAKVVILLGLNQDTYPRKEKKSSLDRLASFSERDYCPTQADYDRYLFLEALLSAEEYFIISYIAEGTANGTKSQPSALVNEFLDYIDANYSLGKEKPSSKILYEHPFFPFDKLYFMPDSKFKSYSKLNYEAAQVYYAPKAEGAAFLKEFCVPDQTIALKTYPIELKALQQLAKNPIQFYLNRTLGIYLNQNLMPPSDLELSSLKRHLLKQKGLKQPLNAILACEDKKRSWPYAPFDLIAKNCITKDVEEIENALEEFSIKKDELIDCELSLSCKKMKFEKNKLHLPALELELDQCKIKLHGKLPLLSKDGFLFFEKKKAIHNYPAALLFLSLPDGIFDKQFLLLDKKKTVPLLERSHERLLGFIRYYFLAQNAISPLMPDWVYPLIEGSEDKLLAQMAKSDSFGTFQDPYVKWVLNEEALPNAKAIIEGWQKLAEDLYGTLLSMWE